MKKVDPKQRPEYSHLVINKNLRNILLMAVGGATVISSAVIFAEVQLEHHWTLVLGLGSVSGIVLTFFPPTESWVYNSWQKSPQRLERHDGK